MTAYRGNPPNFQALYANGAPLSGGKVFTYASGTTTPLATFTSSSGGTENANPVTLGTRGEAVIYWSDTNYKVTVKDASGNTIWTVDPYDPYRAVGAGYRILDQVKATYPTARESSAIFFKPLGSSTVSKWSTGTTAETWADTPHDYLCVGGSYLWGGGGTESLYRRALSTTDTSLAWTEVITHAELLTACGGEPAGYVSHSTYFLAGSDDTLYVLVSIIATTNKAYFLHGTPGALTAQEVTYVTGTDLQRPFWAGTDGTIPCWTSKSITTARLFYWNGSTVMEFDLSALPPPRYAQTVAIVGSVVYLRYEEYGEVVAYHSYKYSSGSWSDIISAWDANSDYILGVGSDGTIFVKGNAEDANGVATFDGTSTWGILESNEVFQGSAATVLTGTTLDAPYRLTQFVNGDYFHINNGSAE